MRREYGFCQNYGCEGIDNGSGLFEDGVCQGCGVKNPRYNAVHFANEARVFKELDNIPSADELLESGRWEETNQIVLGTFRDIQTLMLKFNYSMELVPGGSTQSQIESAQHCRSMRDGAGAGIICVKLIKKERT